MLNCEVIISPEPWCARYGAREGAVVGVQRQAEGGDRTVCHAGDAAAPAAGVRGRRTETLPPTSKVRPFFVFVGGACAGAGAGLCFVRLAESRRIIWVSMVLLDRQAYKRHKKVPGER